MGKKFYEAPNADVVAVEAPPLLAGSGDSDEESELQLTNTVPSIWNDDNQFAKQNKDNLIWNE